MKRPIVLLAAIPLALGGCAGSPVAGTSDPGTPTTTPTASPAPSPTPTPPSPTPSPTQTAVALGCSPWTVGTASIGPEYFENACIDHSFAESASAGTALNAPDMCPWYGLIAADDEVGFYVSALSDPESPGESINYFVMHWYTDPADAASYGTPQTPEGITIGSSAADVLAAYPTAVPVDFDDIARGARSQLVVSTGPETSYNFDIVDDVVTEISWGKYLGQGGPSGDQCAI